MSTNLRQIEVILYRLKRNFGRPITIKNPTTNDYNLETGEVTRDYDTKEIKRAIILPASEVRNFSQSLYEEEFKRGGYFDVTDKLVIIDSKDLNGTTINLNSKVDIGSDTYSIKKSTKAEDNKSYLLVLKNLSNE